MQKKELQEQIKSAKECLIICEDDSLKNLKRIADGLRLLAYEVDNLSMYYKAMSNWKNQISKCQDELNKLEDKEK